MRPSAVVLLCMVALFCAVEAAPTKKRPSKYVPTPRPGTHPKKHGCRGKRCYSPRPKDEKVNRADSNTDIYINGYHGTATAYTDASSTKKQVASDSVAAGEIYDAYVAINTDGEAFGPNKYAATDVNMEAGARHATLVGGASANCRKEIGQRFQRSHRRCYERLCRRRQRSHRCDGPKEERISTRLSDSTCISCRAFSFRGFHRILRSLVLLHAVDSAGVP